MIRLRISRRFLRIAACIALALTAIGGLYALGDRVTPRNDGRPVIWSPSIRAMERYRARALRWTETMAEIDHRLAALLAEEASNTSSAIYTQEREIAEVGERAVALERQIIETETPIALLGLRERATASAIAYREAARMAAQYLNNPESEHLNNAMAALGEAAKMREEMEKSRWLVEEEEKNE
jgi:hypothetical protein